MRSIISKGSQGILVDIECHLSNNLPTIIIVGSASKAVDEAKERIRGAFATSHIMLPRKRVTINLAPADIPKVDSGFDLAMAVSILLADGQVNCDLSSNQAFIGELGLDGNLRAVRGIIGKILLGRAKGITTFFIPADNLEQASLIPQVTLMPIKNLQQLYGQLSLANPIKQFKTGHGKSVKPVGIVNGRLNEVIGQQQAKRALEIAAAGGHNVLLFGPPGTGKSMLAKALASILPPLSREEMLEVTHLHSLAGQDYDQLITNRPFRSPHHSASHVAIVGGGSRLRPGEISLAHRGVLFMDELPEFDRDTLEALRQPLEDRVINVARVKENALYPANFVLVATANPCPCGFKGQDACKCSTSEVNKYQKRLSGPIMDRIDIYCHVGEVECSQLLEPPIKSKQDSTAAERVIKARQRQLERFGDSRKLNADMSSHEVKQLAALSAQALDLLNEAAGRKKLSARGYLHIAKVSRTIADLNDSPLVEVGHMSNAIRYRLDPFKESK